MIWQPLLVLAYLRKGETFAELAAGFGVGTATAPGAPGSWPRRSTFSHAREIAG